jgi:thioredoxin reductase (NADPH)
MLKPVILTVDDEPEVLRAVTRDLRRQYGRDYQLVAAGSGDEALEALRQLKLRDTPVAILLVDQRMPGMTGIEFLGEALKLYPSAKRALLTAYADTEVAIKAINQLKLDYYLMKPWDPPEQYLYPVIDDLLEDWRVGYEPPIQGIRVLGNRWSPLSHQIKDFLARNQVPYRWLDVESGEEARNLMQSPELQGARLPVVVFEDGSILQQPSNAEIAAKLGRSLKASMPFYDLIIVGAGPAGLAAAVYGASEGLRTLLIEREAAGGQAGTSSRIENYLGFPSGLSGWDLARRAVTQAVRFGVELLVPQEVMAVRVEDPYRIVMLGDRTEISCHALLIATGVTYRKLDVPGAERLTGAGVYYGGSQAEAIFYRGEDVYIVGGANSAGQAAVYFSRYCRMVTMLVRGASIEAGMSQYLVDQIRSTDNIRVLLNTSVVEAHGADRLEAITVKDSLTGETCTLPATALFIFIGAYPHTDWLAGLLERDDFGFILSGSDLIKDGKPPAGWPLKRLPYWLETSVPGIFVAGDVRHRSIKRMASAVGEGAMAVQFIHQYLSTLGPTPARI